MQGTGFNAIAGNPLADDEDVECELGSDDVSNLNCCRDKAKANVCLSTGSPPNPPLDGSQCVMTLDLLGQWKRMDVTSVTPTRIITEVPDPGLLCVGEGYLQSLMVRKRDAFATPITVQQDYCRNVPQ